MKLTIAGALSGLLLAGASFLNPALAQSTETASAEVAAAAEQAPEPLSVEEMEILVARIALYPDELVAVITASSLYPLQIIEAQRFLDDSKTKKDLKPKSTWDGSVVSLLNYPEIVGMMSDDLDWTQMLGEAIVNQQDDVLTAIQQLRERAVAEGVIKSDEKVKIVEENDNIVIQPASKEVIYVPQYEPQMLYDPGYVAQPISYYPDPYPYYYDPVAPFFAGAVTGIIWAGIVDWDDGFWGGSWGNNWGGGDIDIDCNKCFNNIDFDGKVNWNNVDWKNVDRSKIKFDKTQLNKIDRTNIKNSIKTNDRNKIKNKAGTIKNNRPTTLPGKGNAPTKDIRKDTLEGLKKNPQARPADKVGKPGQGVGDKVAKPGQGAGNKMADKRPAKIDRPVGKPKPAAKMDKRPNKVSPVGEMGPGKVTNKASNRGAKSMGGGMKKKPLPKVSGGGGGGHRAVKRGGGGRRR